MPKIWSYAQRQRLGYEKGILRHFNMDTDFSFENITDSENCELIGWIKTSFGNYYKIRCRIADFPNSCPEAYVVYPKMRDFHGRRLTEYGTSHSMHLLTPKNDEVHMCLYKSDFWNPNNTLVQLILKAKIWLEAYEQHMRTGMDIDTFVNSY